MIENEFFHDTATSTAENESLLGFETDGIFVAIRNRRDLGSDVDSRNRIVVGIQNRRDLGSIGGSIRILLALFFLRHPLASICGLYDE